MSNTEKSVWDELIGLMEEDDETLDNEQERYYYFNGNPLNEEQKSVVDDSFGDGMKHRIITVSAGPGSGKTTALVNRMVKLIEKDGVQPEDIVLLTFTNKAKDEMRNRFFKMVKEKKRAKAVVFNTFHAYAAHLANAVPTIDLQVFEDAINKLNNPSKYGEPVEKYAKKKYLMLDEAQDMKGLYFELICGLIKYNYNAHEDDFMQVTAVFDIDQAIFGYDGADDGLVRRLRKINKEGRNLNTECEDTISTCFKVNYRSTKEIVDYSEEFREYYFKEFNIPIERDFKDKMRSGFGDAKYGRKGNIGLINCGIEDEFRNVMIDKIYNDVINYNEEIPVTIGVLVPQNKDVRYIYSMLSKFFHNNDIIVEHTAAYGSDEDERGENNFSLDCLDEFHALLKRLHDRKDNNGKLTLEAYEESLEDLAEKYKNSKYLDGVRRFSNERVTDQLVYSDYIDYKEFWLELRAARFEEFYLDYIVDQGKEAKVTITVSTIHKAKGREFSWVYLSKIQNQPKTTGPLRLTPSPSSDLIKNRYVAITRAQWKLVIIDNDPHNNYERFKEQQIEYPVYEMKHKDIFESVDNLRVCIPYTPKDFYLSYMPPIKNFQTFIKHGNSREDDPELETFFEDTPERYQAGEDLSYVQRGTEVFFYAKGDGEQQKRLREYRIVKDAVVNVVMIYRSIKKGTDEAGVDKPFNNNYDSTAGDRFFEQYPEMLSYEGQKVKRKLILPMVWYDTEG